jgi:adenine-specific DNA-methyltransferase
MGLSAKYESLQDFFTEADELRLLMIELLGDVTGMKILEPCGGEGAFIKDLKGKPKHIDIIEISERYVAKLMSRFPWANVIHQDFFHFFVDNALLRAATLQSSYDAVICNPPYGLKLDIAYRKLVKKKFPEIYARESYGLFFHFALSLLKDGGRYVFIMPDTFMSSRNHRSLREFILKSGAPSHIIQFKSKRFESVDFGYGNLCIIAGHRNKLTANKKVQWIDATEYNGHISIKSFDSENVVRGKELIDHVRDGWFHPIRRTNLSRFNDSIQLGEIAECRTGIYTGDNPRFLGFDSQMQSKRKNGHELDWNQRVRLTPLSDEEMKLGIEGERCYVPIIRGGHRKPFEQTQWAIDWSRSAVRYYDKDQKARLQNHLFYFRAGLAVPMVTSGKLTASLMENSIFDQGVVGIFPRSEEWVPLLLIFLNHPIATEMKLSINPSANNSSNYLKRLPIPNANEEFKTEALEIVQLARITSWDATAKKRDNLIKSLLG